MPHISTKDYRYLSGFRPTGGLHLGNYLGAIKPLIGLPNKTVFVADMHQINIGDSVEKTKSCLSKYFDKVTIESKHLTDILYIAHLLSFYATTGQLKRMTQFKDKSKTENPTLSLFAYPVLMAADIFFFRANKIVVGIDQKQHIEFARDLYDTAIPNNTYKPEAHIIGVRKVYDLKNPAIKMSKSSIEQSGVIYLDDTKDVIAKKIRMATAATNYTDDTLGAMNLKSLLREFGGNPDEHNGFGSLKSELTDRIILEISNG